MNLGIAAGDTASTTTRDSILRFRGVRYAASGRFAHPESIPADPSALVTATVAGPICPQIPSALDTLLGGATQPADEDCLSLNVFTPACDDAGRPVVVWIHGGAFVTGSSTMPWYDGSQLAALGDVVVVGINYRLGAFGFTADADLGLEDQMAALHWVQRHIASFGGDPMRVTVLGESAGGCSVIALMASSQSQHLFAQAWAMSPSIPQIRTPDEALDSWTRLCTAAGVDDAEGLATLELSRLLDAQAEVLADPNRALRAFSPTAGGSVLPEDVDAAVAADPRPLVIGTTRDEMMLFTAFDPKMAALNPAELRRRISRRLDDRAEAAIEAYRQLRPGANSGQLLSAFQTDETFRVPARQIAELRDRSSHPTWMYWFTYATPVFGGLLGACHGLDIPFVFANLDMPGVTMFTGEGDDRFGVASTFAGGLLSFAHASKPGWERYELPTRATYQVDRASEVIYDPEPRLREIWADGN